MIAQTQRPPNPMIYTTMLGVNFFSKNFSLSWSPKDFFPGLCNLSLLLHPFQKSPAEPGFTKVARIGRTDSLKLTALDLFQIISGSF